MRRCFTFIPLLALVTGCSLGNSYAPVSGRVTIDGKPLANATVSFQPIAPEGTRDVVPGSTGKTNENGEFTLVRSNGENGAWVGKHRVVITAVADTVGDSDARPARASKSQTDKSQSEKVPPKYKALKDTFDVPPGGTTNADVAVTIVIDPTPKKEAKDTRN